MKFGKYLENNQVPEWTDKYVQYKQLRKNVKRFKLEIESIKNRMTSEAEDDPANNPESHDEDIHVNRNQMGDQDIEHGSIINDGGEHSEGIQMQNLGDPLMTDKLFIRNSQTSSVLKRTYSTLMLRGHRERGRSRVRESSLVRETGGNGGSSGGGNHSTGDIQLLLINANSQSILSSGAPLERRTLQRLREIQDETIQLILAEADKVNDFYKEREAEAVKRFNQIYSQVSFLIKLRKQDDGADDNNNNNNKNNQQTQDYQQQHNNDQVVEIKKDNNNNETEDEKDDDDDDNDEDDIDGQEYIDDAKEHLNKQLQQEHDNQHDEHDECDITSLQETTESTLTTTTTSHQPLDFFKSFPRILDVVKIRHDMFMPLESKAKKWIQLGKQKSNEQTVRDIILEFYKYLVLLKNFKVINYTATLKIIKKGEKNTELVLGEKIMDRLDDYEFKTSKVIDKLSNSLEKLYAEVFTNGKLRDARKQMRNSDPQNTNQTSTISVFFSGLCAGWTTAIFILIYYILYTGEYNDFVRFSTVYNLYATLGLVILWALMFGINLYIWTKSHVHYSFIFEISKTKLTFQKVFLAVTVMSVLWVTSIGVYMWSSMGLEDGTFPFPFVPPEFTPLLLLGIYLIMLVCPFDFFQLSVRKWFLQTIWRVVTAPLKPVKFAHFFMGDQLSSLVLVLVQMSQFICFYTTDVYNPVNQSVCSKRGRYINPFISAAPATWRFLQCLRRYNDSKDFVHLRNALKYFLSIVVVFFSTMDSFYSVGWSSPWRIIWLISGVANSSYSYWWDLMMDWSILVKPKNEADRFNPFKFTLRKKRMYSPTFIYYIAIITNLAFRATWTLTKSLPQLTSLLPSYKLVVIIGMVEITRRGQWNVYRLENEHINNCGKFRATRDIPLPFMAE